MNHKNSKENQNKIQTSRIKVKIIQILKSKVNTKINQVDATRHKFKNILTKIIL